MEDDVIKKPLQKERREREEKRDMNGNSCYKNKSVQNL